MVFGADCWDSTSTRRTLPSQSEGDKGPLFGDWGKDCRIQLIIHRFAREMNALAVLLLHRSLCKLATLVNPASWSKMYKSEKCELCAR